MGKDWITEVRSVAEPLAESLGLTLWGVELVGGGRPTVRIFVENDPIVKVSDGVAFTEGRLLTPSDVPTDETLYRVSVEQCAELSRLVSLSMDVEDSFDGAWVLEVSSPGLERVFFNLGQMRPYEGREVDVLLSVPHPTWPVAEGLPGRKKFRGMLVCIDGTSFVLNIPESSRLPEDPENVKIEWSVVRRAHLVHVFPERTLPGKGTKAAKKTPKSGGNI